MIAAENAIKKYHIAITCASANKMYFRLYSICFTINDIVIFKQQATLSTMPGACVLARLSSARAFPICSRRNKSDIYFHWELII